MAPMSANRPVQNMTFTHHGWVARTYRMLGGSGSTSMVFTSAALTIALYLAVHTSCVDASQLIRHRKLPCVHNWFTAALTADMAIRPVLHNKAQRMTNWEAELTDH